MIPENRPGEGQELALPSAEILAALVDARVDPGCSAELGAPPLKELERADASQRVHCTSPIGHRIGDRDVREDGAREQEDVLRDDRKQSPKRVRVVGEHVPAKHPDGATLRLVEPQQEACDDAFRPGRPHEGDSFAAARDEAHVTQHGLAGLVFEIHVLERDGLVCGAGRQPLSDDRRIR